jgi:carbon-monoxide dehydrogenase medium subunit
MNRFEYVMPATIKEAIEAISAYGEGARYIAGGTDVLVRVKAGLKVDCLVSLRRVKELKGIALGNGGGTFSMGGGTTFREILKSDLLRENLPALWEASKVLANPQVRNVATIAGNISNAAPSADSVPPLMVLDTFLVLEGPSGTRTMPIQEFFLGPGATKKDPREVLKEIRVRVPGPDTRTSFIKIGRVSQDIAIANGAISLDMDRGTVKDVRICLGAVAPTPLRLHAIEERLRGNEITETLLKEVQRMAEKEVSPISDVRASEDYRRHLSGVIVKRLILMAQGQKES